MTDTQESPSAREWKPQSRLLRDYSVLFDKPILRIIITDNCVTSIFHSFEYIFLDDILANLVLVLFPLSLTVDEFLNIYLILEWSIVVLELGLIDAVVDHGFEGITQVLLALPRQLENFDHGLVGDHRQLRLHESLVDFIDLRLLIFFFLCHSNTLFDISSCYFDLAESGSRCLLSHLPNVFELLFSCEEVVMSYI